MIRHTIGFNFKSGLDSSRIDLLLNRIRELRSIDGVQNFALGRQLDRAGVYGQLLARDFEYIVTMEFDSEEALERFLSHPTHTALAREIGPAERDRQARALRF